MNNQVWDGTCQLISHSTLNFIPQLFFSLDVTVCLKTIWLETLDYKGNVSILENK